MKAIIYTEYGTSDVLQLKDVPKPIPKGNEVLIKVKAVSINDFDLGLLQGKPFVNRLTNGIRRPKKITILGSDIAGIVEAVGQKVENFQVGDEVYGDLTDTWGGFAQYVCADKGAIIRKPSNMTFEEAAAIPQAAMLAVQGLIDRGKIKKGRKLLINGAGGGVGTFGVQIAKLFDCEVTGVDCTEKIEYMSELGYDEVIDYTKEDFTKLGPRYDLILDNKTNRSIFSYLKSLNPHGIYVTNGGAISRLLQAVLLGPWISMIYKKKVRVVALKPNKDLAYINDLFEKGQLKVVIDGSYKLEDAREAMRLFEKGKHKGKIVITVE